MKLDWDELNNGEPECRYYQQALALAKGGFDIGWELCQGRGLDPCEYRLVCSARNGMEGCISKSDSVWFLALDKIVARRKAAPGFDLPSSEIAAANEALLDTEEEKAIYRARAERDG